MLAIRFIFIVLLGIHAQWALATLPIQHWQSPSGAKVLFIESRDLPILDVSVDFSADENKEFLDSRVRLVSLNGNHIQSLCRLWRLLRAEAPDVSLSALGVSNLKHFIAAGALLRWRRAVMTFHGYFHSEPKLLSRLGNLATPLISRLTGASVAVSQGLRNSIVRKWRSSPQRTSYIYNPVVTEHGHKHLTAADLAARPPVFLALGRLVDYKNFPVLIRAFANIANREAKLVILGDGPERTRLELLVRQLGLQDRVSMPGYLPEPWPHYDAARCFVLPSRTESFGNVVIEAMAHGLPVVSTDCQGPQELLDHGRFGEIVPVGDTLQLAAAMSRALADPGDPQPRIRRAQEFTVDIALDRYEALIERVIAKAG